MGVELRERKWCRVLGIEKVGVEGYWKKKIIANGLIQSHLYYHYWQKKSATNLK